MVREPHVDEQGRLFCPAYSPYHAWHEIVAEQGEMTEDLGAQLVELGIVEPIRQGRGGVYTKDLAPVTGTGKANARTGKPEAGARAGGYAGDSDRLGYLDEDVIFGGDLSGHFGHMILDGFPRLWWHVAHPEDTRRYVFVVRARRSFQDEFFNLLGIPDERIMFIREATQFRSVLVPDESYYPWGKGKTYHPSHAIAPFRRIRDRACELSHATRHERIYLTRTRLTGRREVHGERFFEDFYRARGYEIVAPETLPLIDQIALVGSAKDVVCTMGTLAHSALFAREGTRFTYLLSNDKRTLDPQGWIDRCVGTDWRMVDVSQSFLTTFVSRRALVGSSLIGPTPSFKRYVHDVFGEEIDVKLSDDALAYIDSWLSYYTENYSRAIEWTTYDIMSSLSEVARGQSFEENWFEQAILLTMEARIEKARRLEERTDPAGPAKVRKNVLPYPYPQKTTVKNGIEWTDLGNGRIDLHGTATKTTKFALTAPLERSDFRTGQRKFVVSLGVSGSGKKTFFINGDVGNKTGESVMLETVRIASGPAFGGMIVIDTAGYEYFGKLYIVVKKGMSFNHKVLEPMISPADVWNGKWEPYQPEPDSRTKEQ